MFHIISTSSCKWCVKAKELLASKGLSFTEQILDTEEKKLAFKGRGFTTVPQIFLRNSVSNGPIDEYFVHIGGYEDLAEHLAKD